MGTIFTKARNGLLAASVLATLGFGAAQAFARPADPQEAQVCAPGRCDRECKERFGSFASGFCEMGVCTCAV